MKIRAVYFKIAGMDRAVSFWQGFFDQAPQKRSPYWFEFKAKSINFGLLWEEGYRVQAGLGRPGQYA